MIADAQRLDVLGSYLLLDSAPRALFIEKQFGIWERWESAGAEWYELVGDLTQAIEQIMCLVKYEKNKELAARLDVLYIQMRKLNEEWEKLDIDPF